jgi:hypothetical protein
VAGAVAAFVALFPPSLRGGPAGRRVPTIRRPREVAAEPQPSSPAEQALPR